MTTSRAAIVSASLELLNEGGLRAVTLRALAKRLGVSAPTLYWHVKGKRHLLDLAAEQILDAVLAGWELPAGVPWEQWLADRTRQIRAGLVAYPDGALVLSGSRLSPRWIPNIERLLEALVEEGFTPVDALRSLIALNSYTMGDALEAQSAAARDPEELTEIVETREEIHSGNHPLLSKAAGDFGSDQDRFEHGLALIIDGMKSRLAAG